MSGRSDLHIAMDRCDAEHRRHRIRCAIAAVVVAAILFAAATEPVWRAQL